MRPPVNLPVRPTTDFAKSALFNILNNYFDFEELSVLDLFAGAGSIAFEFASRGTNSITCVDDNIQCIQFIKKAALEFNLTGFNCIRSEVFGFISKESKKYDIVFADPPFEMEETDRLPDLILENNYLSPNGWLIVEHQSKRHLNSIAKPFDIRKYGNCGFSFYKTESK